jgi:ABC-type transporter Mla maintaining outer membrane lipid asymmetry permease subunit MlaE
MMTRVIYIFVVGSLLTGCAQFAASVGGTFIGNIASDQYIQSHEKHDVKVVDKSRRKR